MRGLVAQEGNLAVVDFGRTAPASLSKKQLASQLGRSSRWIEMRVSEGMPSSMDRKGRRKFVLAECRSWLQQNGRSVA